MNKNEMSLVKKVKDWYIQGFQLHKCYVEDWDEIKSIFKLYGLNLSEHGPILTINELKNVRIAKGLTDSLMYDQDIREMANGKAIETENQIKGRIFLTILRIYPEFCNKLGEKIFENWMKNPDQNLSKIFDLEGTMKDTEKEIEDIISEVVFLFKKEVFKNLKKVK